MIQTTPMKNRHLLNGGVQPTKRRQSPSPPFTVFLLTLVLSGWAVPRAAAQPRSEKPSPPAEETRLGQTTFRNGLKNRGLTELLELHLHDFPPAGEAEALLLYRDVKLAHYADANKSPEARHAAVTEANQILESLIAKHPDDMRSFQWRFDLARSLLYEQAEQLISAVLFRGLGREDRAELLQVTSRTIAILSALLAELAIEYERLESLPIPQFEQLDRTGYVERVDLIGPQADYLLLWARLYDALPRDDQDRTRAKRLNGIQAYLVANPAVLETPHETSGIQIPALVIAGITHRLLNKHAKARQLLDRALQVAERVRDPAERARVRWAVNAAAIERIRNDRDDGRFSHALKSVKRFQQGIDGRSDDHFSLSLVAALLERSIYRAKATGISSNPRAARMRERAWQNLADLARRHPERKDEIYATVHAVIDSDAALAALDSFERCALIAGLLAESGERPSPTDPRLAKIIRIGETFLSTVSEQTRIFVPEVLFNMAVAEYRRNRPTKAAERFLQVARNHMIWDEALQAAIYAVQLSNKLHEGTEAGADHVAARDLYRKSLDALVTYYPQSEATRYWRFFYAQLLDEVAEFDTAAAQYALVHEDHTRFFEAAFARVRCLALALDAASLESPEDLLLLRKRTDEFFSVQRAFVSRAGAQLIGLGDDDRASTLKRFLARAKLIGAEMKVLPVVNRPAQALETLRDFERDYPEAASMIGRVWRVRLMAYESLGELAEAARAVPAYVAADPKRAGPTLQLLYTDLADDARELRAKGDEAGGRRKAEVALLLAEQIMTWANQFNEDVSDEQQRSLVIQLAEARLAVDQYQQARDLFASCFAVSEDIPGRGDTKDVRVVYGYAESQFRLEEWAEALVRFNSLAMSLPADDPIRWRSLLRDLQCRTALEHPPQGIIKVIQQQRHLYPEMGDPLLAREFDKLQRQNQRRVDRASG